MGSGVLTSLVRLSAVRPALRPSAASAAAPAGMLSPQEKRPRIDFEVQVAVASALSGGVALGPLAVSASTQVAQLKAHLAAHLRCKAGALRLFSGHAELPDADRLGEHCEESTAASGSPLEISFVKSRSSGVSRIRFIHSSN